MFKKLSAVQKRCLEKRRESICVYLSSEDLEAKHIDTIMQLVDLYGLVHSAVPRRGATARDIHRQAEAAALSQQKKVWRALKNVAPDERKAQSVSAAQATRRKVNAQLYQRVRGSAVIPRFASPEDRRRETIGRRPDLEVTHFLQIGARYLKDECDQTPDHCEECLANVLLRAEGNLQPSRSRARKMKDGVHTRLMEAPELDDFDYCIAIGQDPGEEWVPLSLPISPQYKAPTQS
jgi:hypothetical protein